MRAASEPPTSRAAKAWRSLTSTTPRGLKRELIAHLGTLDFVTAKDNVLLLGPPGTGKTHCETPGWVLMRVRTAGSTIGCC